MWTPRTTRGYVLPRFLWEAEVQLGNSSIWDLIVDVAAMMARDTALRVSHDGGQ